jgi:hypothetical protein
MTTDQKNLPALLEDIRTELTTAYNFKSTSPSAQECINCALDSLDQIAALARPEPASTPVAVEDEPSEIEEIISCLGDDAAMLIAENPDNEMAQTMLDAIVLIEKLSTEAVLLGMAQAAPTEAQPVAVDSINTDDEFHKLFMAARSAFGVHPQLPYQKMIRHIDAHVAAQCKEAYEQGIYDESMNQGPDTWPAQAAPQGQQSAASGGAIETEPSCEGVHLYGNDPEGGIRCSNCGEPWEEVTAAKADPAQESIDPVAATLMRAGESRENAITMAAESRAANAQDAGVPTEFDKLLTVFGNLQFDCGAWNNDSEDNTTTYEALVEQSVKARAAVREASGRDAALEEAALEEAAKVADDLCSAARKCGNQEREYGLYIVAQDIRKLKTKGGAA